MSLQWHQAKMVELLLNQCSAVAKHTLELHRETVLSRFKECPVQNSFWLALMPWKGRGNCTIGEQPRVGLKHLNYSRQCLTHFG